MRAWLWLVPVLLGVALLSPTSRAGEGEGGGKITVVTESPVALGSILRAELTGATVGQAFRLLEQALGGKAQFVVNAGAKDVPLPAVTLKDTNALGLMHLIAHLVPDLRIRVGLGTEFARLQYVIELVSQNSLQSAFETTRGTHVVLVDLAVEDESGSAIERKLRIYRLADVQPIVDKGMSVDDLATAIESVWEVEPIPHVATLKYHKETNLLVVFGTPRHLALVDQVIEGISGRPPAASQAGRVADLEASLNELRVKAEGLGVTVDNHVKTFERIQEQLQELERAVPKPVPPGAGPK